MSQGPDGMLIRNNDDQGGVFWITNYVGYLGGFGFGEPSGARECEVFCCWGFDFVESLRSGV